MAETPERMLLALTVEGFKKIRVAQFDFGPAPGLALITGGNGQGKTSALDALSACFEGRGVIDGPRIINDQSTQCVIRADLGDLHVVRTIRVGEDGKLATTVIVRSADGRAKWDSPTTMLKSFLGTFSFDPLKFLDMKPVEKFKAMQQFVPGFDFEMSQRKYDGLFAARTDVNREVLRYTRAAEAIAFPPDTPKARVDIGRLNRELEQAGVKNANRATIVAALNNAKAEAVRFRGAIADMEAQIVSLQERIGKGLAAIEKLEAANRDTVVPDEIDTTALRRELDRANAVNRNVDLLKQRQEHERMAADQERESNEMTAELQAIKDAQRDAVAAAKMPIEGLSMGEGVVTLNGHPFEQASHAEQLRASIAIAGAENPKLRVVSVREGSLLDSKSLKIVADFAIERGLKVIMERVDETGGVGFVMEDGAIVSSPASRAAASPSTSQKKGKPK